MRTLLPVSVGSVAPLTPDFFGRMVRVESANDRLWNIEERCIRSFDRTAWRDYRCDRCNRMISMGEMYIGRVMVNSKNIWTEHEHRRLRLLRVDARDQEEDDEDEGGDSTHGDGNHMT